MLYEVITRLHHLVERDREFNADVSHELRSPLTVITGATELLLAQPDLDEKVRTRLLRIARAARQSADITTALLHLVRAEQGTDKDSSAHNVGRIVADVVHLYEPLIGNKSLQLRLVEEERVSVIAPESVVAVTVGNLIGNAMRYTTEGEVVVTIGVITSYSIHYTKLYDAWTVLERRERLSNSMSARPNVSAPWRRPRVERSCGQGP